MLIHLKVLVDIIKVSTRVVEEANKELIEVARRSDPSVLRQRAYSRLSYNSWMADVLEELARRCPVVFKIPSGLLESSISPKKKNPVICLIYGIIMFLMLNLIGITTTNAKKKQRTTTFCVYLLTRTKNIKTCVAKKGHVTYVLIYYDIWIVRCFR